MANYFLKVSKDLFGMGLNPTEILLLAQFMEFQSNTGDCFISDSKLASNFGVSESTITRALKALENRGFITRATRNAKGGKERHIRVNTNKIEECATSIKMSLVEAHKHQNDCCTSINLTVDKAQNDLIKDNIKDKDIKDNKGELFQPTAETTLQQLPQEQEVIEEIAVHQLLSMGAQYEVTQDNLIRIKDTGKLFKIKGN